MTSSTISSVTATIDHTTMTTPMAMSSTNTAMAMSTSTDGSMSMSSMSFHTSIFDFLFSKGWTPSSRGQYAGTCIFLIVLAVIYRMTHVLKHRTERYFNARARQFARNIATAHLQMDQNAGSFEKSAGEVTIGPERPLQFRNVRPWRVSMDIPLSLIQLVLSGVSYLLMLAVMTFNVGYFLSVLGGIFLGELLFGRFTSNIEGH
ncbi:Ctr copper transporter family-domain-containing protein [Lipomyces doorenjongii]|uniref:Ctr copper transporter family-domain-containing protein n=1 Tax=Lipomyces doorenjongii TaxID=383834 RepID=UPI0034CEA65C